MKILIGSTSEADYDDTSVEYDTHVERLWFFTVALILLWSFEGLCKNGWRCSAPFDDENSLDDNAGWKSVNRWECSQIFTHNYAKPVPAHVANFLTKLWVPKWESNSPNTWWLKIRSFFCGSVIVSRDVGDIAATSPLLLTITKALSANSKTRLRFSKA
jgi:hypothetical protein